MKKFLAFSSSVDHKVHVLFQRLGLKIGHRPFLYLFITILITGIFGSGMSQFSQRAESRVEKLWIPQNSQALVDQEVLFYFFRLLYFRLSMSFLEKHLVLNYFSQPVNPGKKTFWVHPMCNPL